MESRNATILFAEAKNESKEALFAAAQSFRGRHVKSIGTTYLFMFDDPQAACETALKLKKSSQPISFRIGIARGQVSVSKGDVFGDTVNLAARLQGIAKNQEIFISQEVSESVDRFLIPLRTVGSRQFTGVPQPVSVFSVESSVSAAATPAPTPTSPKPEASEAKPSKDLFDFSRVDQERIQEEDMIRVTMASKVPTPDSIPFLNEPQLKEAKGGMKRPTGSRTNPEHFLNQKKARQRKKAMIIIGTLTLAVPALVLGGMWLYSKVLIPATQPSNDDQIAEKLKASEVIQSINRPRPKRRKSGEYEPTYGTLSLKTDPPGAMVYLNERKVADRTPVKIGNVPANTPLTLKVAKPGYFDAVQLMNIATDENRELSVALKKN